MTIEPKNKDLRSQLPAPRSSRRSVGGNYVPKKNDEPNEREVTARHYSSGTICVHGKLGNSVTGNPRTQQACRSGESLGSELVSPDHDRHPHLYHRSRLPDAYRKSLFLAQCGSSADCLYSLHVVVAAAQEMVDGKKVIWNIETIDMKYCGKLVIPVCLFT